MRKRISFILSLLVCTIGTTFAQSAAMAVGTSAVIKSLDAMQIPASGEPCGQYFRYSATSEPGKVGSILFTYDVNKGGTTTPTIVTMGSDKIQVNVVKSSPAPVAKVIRQGGPVYPWIQIDISAEDLKQASCLAHSQMASSKLGGR